MTSHELDLVKKLHSPRSVRIGVPYNTKSVESYEVRLICNGCEINWWPCLTYRVADGEVKDWVVPVTPEPFGHPV